MTKKTKQLIIAVIAVFVVGIATWAFINYKAKREKIDQHDMVLAEQFDQAMAIAYPLLENYATSMIDKTDSIEVMAHYGIIILIPKRHVHHLRYWKNLSISGIHPYLR